MDKVTRFFWFYTGRRYKQPWNALIRHKGLYDLDTAYDPAGSHDPACHTLDLHLDEACMWLNNNRVLYHIEWTENDTAIDALSAFFCICFLDKAEAAKFRLFFPRFRVLDDG